MTEIPNAFGGFAPFPNTIMIPTMGLQSAVIGYRFGFGYEQGKRTLRAMSNEQFNDLDEEAEQIIFKRHDSAAINYFKVEMHNWVALQNLIIEKSVEIEVMKANRTPSAFREMFEGFTSGFGQQQKEDAGKFFAGLNDTLLKIMAFFSGHKSDKINTNVSIGVIGTQDPTKVTDTGRRPDSCVILHKKWTGMQQTITKDYDRLAILQAKKQNNFIRQEIKNIQQNQIRIHRELKLQLEKYPACAKRWASNVRKRPSSLGIDSKRIIEINNRIEITKRILKRTNITGKQRTWYKAVLVKLQQELKKLTGGFI